MASCCRVNSEKASELYEACIKAATQEDLAGDLTIKAGTRSLPPFRIRIFSIPDPDFFPFRIRIFSFLDPGSASKNLSILTRKNCF